MVLDNKGIVTYTQFLREDLVILRFVPENGIMPEYRTGQFLTIGVPIPTENFKTVRRAYSIASHPKKKNFLNFEIRGFKNLFRGRLTPIFFYKGKGNKFFGENQREIFLE